MLADEADNDPARTGKASAGLANILCGPKRPDRSTRKSAGRSNHLQSFSSLNWAPIGTKIKRCPRHDRYFGHEQPAQPCCEAPAIFRHRMRVAHGRASIGMPEATLPNCHGHVLLVHDPLISVPETMETAALNPQFFK